MAQYAPLKNIRILNTRPDEQAQALTKTLENYGATVIACSLLQIMPHDFILPHVSDYHYAIFVSYHAVTYFFKSYPHQQWPKSCCPIAIGQATARTLRSYHLQSLIPTQANSESLLALKALTLPHQSILLIKGKQGRLLLQETLHQRQIQLTLCEVYKRQPIPLSPTWMKTIWQEDKVDIILLTSQEAIEYFMTWFNTKDAIQWIQYKPCLVISERLKTIASQYGLQRLFVTSPHHIVKGLIELARIRITL